MISSRCPLPIGTRLSITFSPVCRGSETDFLAIIPGALISTIESTTFFKGPLPSIGLASASTTRPSKPSQQVHLKFYENKKLPDLAL